MFAGGADLDAVEAVCGTDAVENLAALVDASLVTVKETPDGDARIGMLATIHAFASELLTDQEDHDTVDRAHLWHYYVGVLDRGKRLYGPDYLTNRSWFAAEHDNLRVALDTAHTRQAEGLQDEDGRPVLQRMASTSELAGSISTSSTRRTVCLHGASTAPSPTALISSTACQSWRSCRRSRGGTTTLAKRPAERSRWLGALANRGR